MGPAEKGGNCQIGSSCGGKSTKIHAVVDAIGKSAYLQLSSGNVNDRSYNSDEIMLYIEGQEVRHTIPPRSNRHDQRTYDKQRYKKRYLIGSLFCKLKRFRKVATRYDKLAGSFFVMHFVEMAVLFGFSDYPRLYSRVV